MLRKLLIGAGMAYMTNRLMNGRRTGGYSRSGLLGRRGWGGRGW